MTEPIRFPVAIVGASDPVALQEFLATAPANGGIAYLIVAPRLPEDQLTRILQSQAIPSHLIEAQATLEPDHLYVLSGERAIVAVEPPCRIVTIESVLFAPFDACCKLLAPVLGKYGLGVVLGGEGADGALGLTHIREAGGLAAVQEPHSTLTDAMPLYALATSPADLTLPATALPPRLVAYGRQLATTTLEAASQPLPPPVQKQINLIHSHMLRHGAYGLNVYTPHFSLSRIEKRRILLDLPDLTAYTHRLGEQAHEVKLLRQEILSKAQQFFRQPQHLAGLAEHALTRILHGKNHADQVRVWVVGCGAGEEAYTICILLLEAAAAAGKTLEIRVFATDVNEDAIQQARTGLFLRTIAADLSDERLQRFFTLEGDLHRVASSVRQQMIFAPHNPFQSPPFLKLDLVVCRNFLRVLNAERRQQLVDLFYQSLLPQGYLFTGAGEEVQAEYYRAVALGLPLYQRQAGAGSGATTVLAAFPALAATAQNSGIGYEVLYNRHLQRHAPPGILVDGDFNIVYYAAGVSPYLHQPSGRSTEQVLERVHPELRELLAMTLMQAAHTGEPACSQPGAIIADGVEQSVLVCVEPIETLAQQRFLMVLFRTATLPELRQTTAPAKNAADLLKNALAVAYQKLQAVNEEYTSVNTEMSITNEELWSANEELQLKTVELERREEELQFANQELLAINHENQRILEQLRQISTNLQNLMTATNVPTIFLDRRLRIRWFSPAVQDLFNLLPGDEGRPLEHITHRLDYDRLVPDVKAMIATASPHEREISSKDGAWYLMRILPYRTNDHLLDGAVITFFDITERKEAETALRQLNLNLEQRVEERTLELMRSNRELDQFAYIASHDLKAPLRAITNLAEWVQKDNAGLLPAASQEHLSKLRARVARMERLLEDLLTYSRVGRQRHQLEWVETGALVHELRHVLLAPDGFRIEQREPLSTLQTERVPLETILRNLIANAIKHHDRPQEGMVEIATTENGEWVEFSVKDDGPGIAPQFHERIFQVFQSLRPHDELEGSGMGLAIAKKAVESHGGKLWVESQPGQGATFRFTWPKDATQQEAS